MSRRCSTRSAEMIRVLWLRPWALFGGESPSRGGAGRGFVRSPVLGRAATSAAGLLFWTVVRARYRAHPLFASLFPVGATIIALLLVRCARQGAHFSWKRRVYAPDLRWGTRVRET